MWEELPLTKIMHSSLQKGPSHQGVSPCIFSSGDSWLQPPLLAKAAASHQALLRIEAQASYIYLALLLIVATLLISGILL